MTVWTEFRTIWVHRVQVEALEQGQLLEEDRTLTPGTGLADGVVAVIVGQRLFVCRFPAGHVLTGQKPAMPLADTSMTSLVRQNRSIASATKPR